MRTTRRPFEPNQTTARPVLTIYIDFRQLIAVVRRNVQLTPQASRAIQDDFARLFDATRTVAVSSAPTRMNKSAADRAPNSPPKGTP